MLSKLQFLMFGIGSHFNHCFFENIGNAIQDVRHKKEAEG
jgi:hypothetical protein